MILYIIPLENQSPRKGKSMFEDVVKKSILKISPYVPGKPIEEVEREFGIKNAVKLASNENPLGPSKAAVLAVIKKLPGINMYPDASCFRLKNALAKKLGVKFEMIAVGNGSNELEQIIAETFVNPGDEVMFSELSFVVYPMVTHIAGGTPVVVPHRDYRHDIEGFIKRITPKTKLVFLCNPNNPTGTIITKPEFEKFMAAVSPKTIVALDEAYFEYVSDSAYPDGINYLSKYKNLIVLRTFSKIYGLAGLRIGYAVCDPEIIGYIERVRPPFNANLTAQAAAAAALKDKKHVVKTIKNNNGGKKFLYSSFERLGISHVKTNANFIFAKFDRPSSELNEWMLKRGVIIRPQHDHFCRVTIGTMKENRKFVSALEEMLGKKDGKKSRIKKYINKLKRRKK